MWCSPSWRSKASGLSHVRKQADVPRSLPDDSKPIVLPVAVDIPRKPAMANGVANGHQILTNAAAATRKRDADAADLAIHPATKRGKATEAPTDRDDVLVDDSGNGAIMIDDV